jgi:hypothetical protein
MCPTSRTATAFALALALTLSDAQAGPALDLDPVPQTFKHSIHESLPDSDKSSAGQVAALPEEHSSLGNAISESAATARPKWNEPAKTGEVSNAMTNSGGPAIHKVTTPLGTYCVIDRDASGRYKQKRVPCSSSAF